MSFARATVVGAGLAGLSAAVALVRAGIPVSLSESRGEAGGRCRSYLEPKLGLRIDNGNHLVLAGNAAVARYLAVIGASDRLAGPEHCAFHFFDLAAGRGWTVRPNAGRVPWWMLSRHRRPPGTRLGDWLSLAPLLRARAGTVAGHGPAWDRFMAPVLLAALNTAPDEASARLAAAVLREGVGRGGRAMRPRIARPDLAAAFVDPARAWLAARGAPFEPNRRLRAIGFAGDRVTSLDWGEGAQPIAASEAVVLAVPPWVAAALVPGLVVPDAHRAIVNAHFACVPPAGAPAMLGLLGGTAEWLFAYPDRIAVTVSAADTLAESDRDALAASFWADIQRAYGFSAPLPPWQVVKEKRATFAATPAQDARRPLAATRWRNLFLAGDWTQTGLPATIEGALRSGETAAALVSPRLRRPA